MGGVCLLSLVESARLSLKVTTSNECESLQQTLSSSLLLLFVEGFFFFFFFLRVILLLMHTENLCF